MKKVLIKVTATIFIFLFSGMISNMYSEEWIDKVVVDKKFDVKSNAKLVIDHEYGNIRCKNWDKNEISIKVTVSVKTTDAAKAAKIIDKVSVDVDGSSSKVEAYCDLNQSFNGKHKTQVKIDFDIYMPSSVSLELKQQFGTAFIESVSGPTNISSEYGSLEIGTLSNAETNIELEFGEANIGSMLNAIIEVSYSAFNLSDAKNITIETEYSTVTIDNAKLVTMELEGGKAQLGIIDDLIVESEFSILQVRRINKSVTAETEYGSFKIKSVDRGFSSIEILNEYGGVSVNFDEDVVCSFNAKGEFGSFNYPENLINTSYKKVSHTSSIIKGTIGKGTNPSSSFSIVSKYGSVDISSN